ncbi:tudor domain-containing protein 1-like [Leptopilina boulardi]|uniref:tudor domain-containing protein 1-like n=1 Tax=Leptopilina boulardi TaxID=63433 RepID=UPI0021F520E3|nr:tudor domain-containing protein 1-like [Leptopilina boulardi]
MQTMLDDIEVIPNLDINQVGKLLPDEVIKFSESIGHLSVLKLGKSPHYYEEVVVCDVYSPSLFWVHLRKKLQKFEKFSKELHQFYEAESEKYRIPSIAIKVGLNVVCLFGKKWHRGIIKGILPDGHSYVFFYDYGTIENYYPQELYFLNHRFAYLPAQAILCSLNNVKPINKEWKKNIIAEFISKTKYPLCAEVVTKNVEENSMSVNLIDTRGEDDVNINDWLREKDYAIKGNMPCQDDRNFSFTYYKKCLIQLGYSPSIICNLNFNFEEPVINSISNLNNSEAIESFISSEDLSNDNPTSIESGDIYEITYKKNQLKAQELTKKIMNVCHLPRACPPPNKVQSNYKETFRTERKKIVSHSNDDFKFIKIEHIEKNYPQNVQTGTCDLPQFLKRTMHLLDKREEKKTRDNLRNSLNFIEKEDSPERENILQILNL